VLEKQQNIEISQKKQHSDRMTLIEFYL